MKIFYYIFTILIAIIAVFLLISILPITGNYKFFAVQSDSMRPEISKDSVIMIKPFESYNIGDVITFYFLKEKYFTMTHRIVDKIERNNNLFFITQGDYNNAPDTYEVKQDEIIGKVIFKVPYIGYVINYARSLIRF